MIINLTATSEKWILNRRNNTIAYRTVTVISYGFDSLLTYLCIHSRVWRTDSDQLLVSSILRASRYSGRLELRQVRRLAVRSPGG